MAVPQLRSEVLDLCDVVQAILAFNYHYGPENRNLIETIRSEVGSAPARRLRQHRDRLRDIVKYVVHQFGCQINPREFAREFKENSERGLGIGMLPKFEIDKRFANYTDNWIPWDTYPPPVLIHLDFTGNSHRPKQFDWTLPEASLYEDMCIAYNEALDRAQNRPCAHCACPPGKAGRLLPKSCCALGLLFRRGLLEWCSLRLLGPTLREHIR
jgi:hypothetical protein